MSLIRRPSPFGELLSLRQAMDRLFEDSYVRPPGTAAEADRALAVDAYSTPEALVIEAALPGVKPDGVEISLLGDTLTISGSTDEESSRDEEGYSYREIRRGNFSRSLTLPAGLNPEAATAEFENGLLRLNIPKAEESRPRQIRISPSSNGKRTVEAGKEAPAQTEKDS